MSRSFSKKKDKDLEQLITKIRRHTRYDNWREKVLSVGLSEIGGKVPKGVQVHHRKEISTIIRENNIKTLHDALECEELWETSNGVVLKRGEHFILTRLRHYKYITPGFHEFILAWLKNCIVGQFCAPKKPRKEYF